MKKVSILVNGLFLFLAAGFFVVSVAGAQVAEEGNTDFNSRVSQMIPANDPDWPADNPNDGSGTVDCFRYYKFQSVKTVIGAESGPFAPGEKVVFDGEIENGNDYPVVDGYLLVRIGRKNPNYEMGDGTDIVDEFFGLEKASLDSREKKAVKFEWTVPNGLPNGQYTATFFLSAGRKFNLGGLPFTNEVTSGSTSFSVANSQYAEFNMDRTKTTFNGSRYSHIGNWPSVEPGKKGVFEQPIANLSDKEQRIEVSYDLYYWDSLNQQDKLDSRKEILVIPAKESKNATFDMPESKEPVYSLKITASNGIQKEIVNVRLTSVQERPRLNFPAITKFPLNAGEKGELFSCFHNTSAIATEGRMVVVLSDEKGREIGKIEYSGRITPRMQAMAKEFSAGRPLGYLKLSAEMYDKNGKLADKYETVYDCKDFGKCPPDNQIIKGFANRNVFIIFGLLTLVLIVMVFASYRRRTGKRDGMAMLLIIPLIAGTVLFAAPDRVLADQDKEVTSARWLRHKFGSVADMRHLADVSVTNHYTITRYGNATLPIGSSQTFTFDPYKSYLEFVAASGQWDTPVGRSVSGHNFIGVNPDTDQFGYVNFRDMANPATMQRLCNNGDCGSGNLGSLGFSVRIPDGSPAGSDPMKMVSNDPSLATCSGMTCTLTSDKSKRGMTASVSAYIPEAIARLYSIAVWNELCGDSSGSDVLELFGGCFMNGSLNMQKAWHAVGWRKTGYDNGQSWIAYDTVNFVKTGLFTVPATSVDFNIYIAPNNLPTASITSPANGAAPCSGNVTFTGTGTDPDGDTITQYAWDLDGVRMHTGTQSSQTYNLAAGPHTVGLYVYDGYAWSAEVFITVNVQAAVTPICGSGNGGTFGFNTPPSGAALCAPGGASAVTANPTTYSWTCSGGACNGLVVNCQATRAALPVSAFSGNSGSQVNQTTLNINKGDNVVLSWSSSSANAPAVTTNCSASNSARNSNWDNASIGPNGTTAAFPLTQTTIFDLDCRDSIGEATVPNPKSVVVNVVYRCLPDSGCPAGQTKCSGSDTGLTDDTTWSLVDNNDCAASTKKCGCRCNNNTPEDYLWVETAAPDCRGKTCQNATATVSCRALMCGSWISWPTSGGKCGGKDPNPRTDPCPCQDLNWREVQP